MAIVRNDIVKVKLKNRDLQICIENAQFLCETIMDRKDLHLRSYMERYIDILMGEVAETAVINWLHENGKYAVSAVDKKSGKPDLGHDIIVKDTRGKELKCSIKSSLSVYKSDLDEIIDNFTLASKKSEVRDINIQVYYWLNLQGGSHNRTTVPSNENMAIIGWLGSNDIDKYTKYNTEERETVNKKLRDVRTMQSLLSYLI